MVKFDDSLNREIARTVKNFNAKQRYNKTKTKGKGMLPERISGKVIKAKYSDKPKAELMKQLKLYQSFAKRDALKKATENSRITKWEADYFNANLEKTKEFYINEIADLKRIIGNQPEYHLKQHQRLLTLEGKLKELDKDVMSLDENEIDTFRRYFNYAERSEIIKQQGFRLYLSQLKHTMELLDYSNSDIEKLLSKFDVLSENEFTEMVRQEDVIDDIYRMVYSPKGRGTYELLADERDARNAVKRIINDADYLVNKYKTTN